MPRFVILEHSQPGRSCHWDFMLEQDGKLITWQVPAPPAQWGAVPVVCKRIFDHRLKYLDYQGQISGDRGLVKRVDGGEYILRSRASVHLEIELSLLTLSGLIRLEPGQNEYWTLQFMPGRSQIKPDLGD